MLVVEFASSSFIITTAVSCKTFNDMEERKLHVGIPTVQGCDSYYVDNEIIQTLEKKKVCLGTIPPKQLVRVDATSTYYWRNFGWPNSHHTRTVGIVHIDRNSSQ